MITNKNKEIQIAKDDSNREKNNVDKSIEEFKKSKDKAEASLQTISQKVKAIDNYIEGKYKSDYLKRTLNY